MKTILFVLLQSALILSCFADRLNPVNPNFNYPETNKVNKALASNFEL